MRTKWEKTVIVFMLKSCSYCAEEFFDLRVRSKVEEGERTADWNAEI